MCRHPFGEGILVSWSLPFPITGDLQVRFVACLGGLSIEGSEKVKVDSKSVCVHGLSGTRKLRST